MKTRKLRLLATMITLVAVTTATILPAQAQRRSTQQRSENREPEKNSNRRSRVEQKSTFKDYDKVKRTTVNPNLKSTRTVQPKSTPTKTKSSNYSNRAVTTQRTQNNRSSQSATRTPNTNYDNQRKKSSQANTPRNMANTSRDRKIYSSNRSANSDLNRSSNGSAGNRQYASNRGNNSSVRSTERRTTGYYSTNNRDFYRINKSDKRYSPSSNYRGSSKNWTKNYRPDKMNYNHNSKKYYSHYNYNKHNHWDRSWERYRWNHNSWYDYYHGYNPRSYMYNKHYYYHKRYGHVISRFDYRPQVFVHNNHNYYCYDGHFFRYRMGVGYVLVDLPFGFAFDYMPAGYERVYINGYMYFRLGNLFFEWGNHGFSLVHYPERYYASNNDYVSQGYQFDDDYYYDNY